MQENYNEQEITGGQSFGKAALKWLDNFWYHYKWHSLIALFLIFAVLICSLQMCTKTSYDIHIMYAGGYEIRRTSSDGDLPPYTKTLSSLRRAVGDYNDDGSINIAFTDLYTLTEEEIKAITGNGAQDVDLNYYLINENSKLLLDNLTYGNYYLCFISTAIYEKYNTIDGVEIFVPLAQFLDTGADVELYSPTAAKLSSTGFYSLPGIADFPTDTLVCLRNKSALSNHFNKKDAERGYKRGADAIKIILNYPKG